MNLTAIGKLIHILYALMTDPNAQALFDRFKADVQALVNSMHARPAAGLAPASEPAATVTVTGAPGSAVESHPG